MMTASSIGGGDYAAYLESRTAVPERGDYYLGRDGTPAEAPGRWLTSESALARVGVTEPGQVAADDLRALMEGRSATSTREAPLWLRSAGANGTRAAGIDVTFSAPKSVSVVWALATEQVREQFEQAHHRAVVAAVEHMRENVEVIAAREGQPATPVALHAAEFRHSTARGASGAAPDPQLHSHVVVTSAQRADGSVAAVRSRPIFRAAREVGAVYRAYLADGLRDLGFQIEADGDDGRYFRIAGLPKEVDASFSQRSAEIAEAKREFRAAHGRDPERGELRALAVATRAVKELSTRDDLDAAWRATAAERGLTTKEAQKLRTAVSDRVDRAGWAENVEQAVTQNRSVFEDRELRTAGFEHAAGAGLRAAEVADGLAQLRNEGRVIEAGGALLTTKRIREMEVTLHDRIAGMAADRGREIPANARDSAVEAVQERLGASLTAEQREAVGVLTGPQRATVLIGQAGSGKSVVIDAAARAEIAAGRDVFGVAVAGRTAQQLGEDAPSLDDRVSTIDSFVGRVRRGSIAITERSTVYVEEAGMGDTERLASLAAEVEDRGGSVVLIGDASQLPSVGAGGMFAHIAEAAPSAELREVMRTRDADAQGAWRALRDGDPLQAMAHYSATGSLRFSETRTAATDAAAHRYLELAERHGHGEVALMTDASNAEVDALNRRVQFLRAERGDVGARHVTLPDGGPRVYEDDRVVWTRSQPVPGEARVENGVRGTVTDVAEHGHALRVRLDGSNRDVTVPAEDFGAIGLGYASHVYRQQGATVDRAVAVTGGWQTSRETAYVEASRARHGVEWHVARDELEAEHDAQRVELLAARMRMSRAQQPSLAYEAQAVDVDVACPLRSPTVDIEHYEGI